MEAGSLETTLAGGGAVVLGGGGAVVLSEGEEVLAAVEDMMRAIGLFFKICRNADLTEERDG